jgi:hypothetical protein
MLEGPAANVIETSLKWIVPEAVERKFCETESFLGIRHALSRWEVRPLPNGERGYLG